MRMPSVKMGDEVVMLSGKHKGCKAVYSCTLNGVCLLRLMNGIEFIAERHEFEGVNSVH